MMVIIIIIITTTKTAMVAAAAVWVVDGWTSSIPTTTYLLHGAESFLRS